MQSTTRGEGDVGAGEQGAAPVRGKLRRYQFVAGLPGRIDSAACTQDQDEGNRRKSLSRELR